MVPSFSFASIKISFVVQFNSVLDLMNLYVQVGAIILYTYVFQMLALPPGETYDGIAEGKLPSMGCISEPLPEHVLLLDPEDPETTELNSSVREKVG